MNAGKQRPVGIATECSLAAVTAASALSLARLFSGFDALWIVIGFAIGAHLCASILGRLPIFAWLQLPIAAAVGTVAGSWVFFGDSLWAFLPTARTLDAAVDALKDAFSDLSSAVAPVAASPGFDVALAGGFWLLGVVATIQLRNSVHRGIVIAPHLAIFVVGAILARGAEYTSAALVFSGSLLVFALISRYERLGRFPIGTTSTSRPRLAAASVALIAVSALTVASLPAVSKADQFAQLDLRRLGDGAESQTVQSPLVSIRGLLNNEPNKLLFTATIESDQFWRQTALEDFDGISWTSDSSYSNQDSDDELSHQLPVARSLTETPSAATSVTLNNLSSRWLPLPYVTTSLAAPFDLRYDNASESIFLNDLTSEFEDERYTASFTSPMINVDELALATVEAADDDYRLIPSAISPAARSLADVIGSTAVSPYDAALKLQNYFRDGSFEYDTEADYSSDSDPLAAFLDLRVGFCQQFASTYAAVARLIGLPTRIAVGFTSGELAASSDSLRTVRGRDAHAWPEVYFDGFGWLAFEPTPTRSNPAAAPYTGIEEEPTPPDVTPPPTVAESPSVDESTTTTTTAPTTTTSTSTTTSTTSVEDEMIEPTISDDADGPNMLVWLLAAMIGVLAAVGLGLRFRSRRATESDPNRAVATSWERSLRVLRAGGHRLRSGETPAEFMGRCRLDLGSLELGGLELGSLELGNDALGALANAESKRRWSPNGANTTDAHNAQAAVTAITEALRPTFGLRQRLRLALSNLRKPA